MATTLTNIIPPSNNLVNDYYQTSYAVDGSEYDYVYSFFLKAMDDKEAARNFASTLFEVAHQADIAPIEMTRSMEGQSGLELSASLAYYINGTRPNSTMLGVMNRLKPNFHAGRTVII